MKTKYAKERNVPTYAVGESVSVKIPSIDRTLHRCFQDPSCGCEESGQSTGTISLTV